MGLGERIIQLKTKVITIFLLAILFGCAGYSEQIKEEVNKTNLQINETLVEKEKVQQTSLDIINEKIELTCTQEKNKKEIIYGYANDGRILQIGKTKFRYHNKTLLKIENEKKNITLNYEKGKISNIGNTAITRDKLGRIIEIKNPDEKLTITYDSKSLPRQVYLYKTKTSLDYDEKDNVKYITRGMNTLNVYYNEDNLIKDIDADNQNHLIIAYKGKDIAMLSGTLFGTGLTIDYSTDLQNARILNPDDDSKFKTSNNEALHKTVDKYIYCTKIKKTNKIFEANAYAFFRTYFDENFDEYVIMNQYCEAIKDGIKAD